MDIYDSEGYRKEEKYYFPNYMCSYLETRLKMFAYKDANATHGRYVVSSIYFDDNMNSAMNENEDGIDPRNKWRIRIYNCNMSHIVLENKQKLYGLTRKMSQAISLSDFESIMSLNITRRFEQEENRKGFIFERFWIEQLTKGLKPKIIVEYERIPFVYDINTVRITIDRNISCLDRISDFGKSSVQRFPVMEKGQALLEVKYNGYLPSFITHIIQEFDMQRTENSKYYLSRLSCRNRRGE